MDKIALPKLRDDRPPVEYRVRLDPALNDELLFYRRHYMQTYGQEIEPKDLLEPIVRRFWQATAPSGSSRNSIPWRRPRPVSDRRTAHQTPKRHSR